VIEKEHHLRVPIISRQWPAVVKHDWLTFALADSAVDVVIDASTVNTMEPARDAHLKSPDFLDVEEYPTITFKSKAVTTNCDRDLQVEGNLTIHGVTKEVLLKVEGPSREEKVPLGNARIGASASTRIKRSDFGLGWNAALETGGVLVGDNVKIELEVSLIRV
jgi:polyisoprenoid-binding protein YceI